MRNIKQTIVFFLMVSLLLVSMPSRVYAKTTYSEGYFYYQIEDESVTITGYFGTKESIIIPSSIAGYPVSKIAQGAFWETKTVKELHLPDTIMEIESKAIGTHIQVSYDNDNRTDTDDFLGNDNSSLDFDIEEVEGVTSSDSASNGEDGSSSAQERSDDNDTTGVLQDESKDDSNDVLEQDSETDLEKDSAESIEEVDEKKPNDIYIVVIVGVLIVVIAITVFLIYKKRKQ